MKKKLLLVVPLPPPMHGSNLMNQRVVNCRALYGKYKVKILPLHYAVSVADIGSIRFGKIASFFVYLVKLLKLMITFQPAVAYFIPSVAGVSFYRDCLFAFVLKLFGVHVVYHLHARGIKDKLGNLFLLKLYRWFFKGATVIHLSPMLYEDISDVVCFEQCRFLPNGIEDPGCIASDKMFRAESVPAVLFLSNLFLSKGPLILLDACKILVDKNIDFKLYYIGNQTAELSQEEFIRKISELDMESYVEYLGPLYGKDKEEFFLKSDIFVLPTEYETFGLVLLEAMATGLPVVSTSEGAIPEIIDEGVMGYVVDKQDVVKLAEKIEFLILNPEVARKMGEASRSKFEHNYTIEKFYGNLMQIFDGVFESLRKGQV